jgi:cation diffusion facilitator CzcD-associated flavoprotein CzcO
VTLAGPASLTAGPHASDAPASVDLLVVGAGFAGLYMLYKARQLGLRALVVDAAAGVGGTWFHNRYPGARVDIQSLEYSYAFDEALQQDWHWTERYAGQPELLRYANHVADRFGLRDGILLDTRLVRAHFDEASARWVAEAQGGQRWSAQFLVMATGALSAPNTPDLPGLQQFAGQVLHTAQWPRQAVSLSGLRVGVVGTGSSGMQVITAIAPEVAQLTVFQRTANYAVPAHNGPLDPALEARTKADYAGFRERNLRMRGGFGCDLPPNPVSALAVGAAARTAQFEARWQEGGFAFLGAFNDLLLNDEANGLAAEFVRGKVRATVRDPVTAEMLCPRHTLGCKRLCVDTGYYATYNLPHVRLVDLNTSPIEEVTPSGVRVGGREVALDALVLATGFDAMTGALTRIDLVGRGGLSIQQKWAAGPMNYLGLMVAGFPNLFHVAGPGSTAAFTNVMRAIEHHVDWIADAVLHLRRLGLASIEATEAAETDWVAHVQQAARNTIFLSCNSWYVGANIPGKARIFMPLLQGFPAYRARCSEVAATGYSGCHLH